MRDTAAKVSGALGAVGSVALTMNAGSRGGSPALMAIMSAWVLLPFGLILIALRLLRRWPTAVHDVLDVLLAVVSVISILLYAFRRLLVPGKPNAFMFVVVPPALCVFTAISIWVSMHRARSAS